MEINSLNWIHRRRRRSSRLRGGGCSQHHHHHHQPPQRAFGLAAIAGVAFVVFVLLHSANATEASWADALDEEAADGFSANSSNTSISRSGVTAIAVPTLVLDEFDEAATAGPVGQNKSGNFVFLYIKNHQIILILDGIWFGIIIREKICELCIQKIDQVTHSGTRECACFCVCAFKMHSNENLRKHFPPADMRSLVERACAFAYTSIHRFSTTIDRSIAWRKIVLCSKNAFWFLY